MLACCRSNHPSCHSVQIGRERSARPPNDPSCHVPDTFHEEQWHCQRQPPSDAKMHFYPLSLRLALCFPTSLGVLVSWYYSGAVTPSQGQKTPFLALFPTVREWACRRSRQGGDIRGTGEKSGFRAHDLPFGPVHSGRTPIFRCRRGDPIGWRAVVSEAT